MIIELPAKLPEGCWVENEILKVPRSVKWRELTRFITIENNGNSCWYCGKQLKDNEITMDHLYPQDLGGPTVPNNLVPCCKSCNGAKGNLTELQFKQLRKASKKKKGFIKDRFRANNETVRQMRGYFLPKKWISTYKCEEIIAIFNLEENLKSKSYRKIEMFYREYGKIPHPIIVDKNGFLLDGFSTIAFAKNNKIKAIPTIVISNVEVVF